ncbi:MAG: DNA-directed RNA polymerase subunit D [Halobacteriota archaeon]
MSPEVESLESDGTRASFVVRGVSAAFANGVRRALLADVPTMAIDTVDFYENTSVMFDEVLSLRLGLVPLETDLESYSLPEECSCDGEGCTGCEVSVLLDVAAEDDEVVVRSGDLHVEDPEVEPAEDGIPLIELKPGQSVVFEATARLGRGKDHAKNQGASAAGYRHLLEVDGDAEPPEERVRGVVETDDGYVDLEDYDGDVEEALGDVGVREVDDAFVFEVESDGSLAADELVVEAARSLSDRASEIGDLVAT